MSTDISSETESESKSFIGFLNNDYLLQGSSAVALFWFIDNYVASSFPATYRDLISAGLAGAGAVTILAPIFKNLIEGRDITYGVKLNVEVMKDMLFIGGGSAALVYLLRYLFPQSIKFDKSVTHYATIVGSVLASSMFVVPQTRKLLL